MTFKIKRISIDRYGPLDANLDINPEFQCIFGPNESGKTLLIDAILKMTLPRDLQKLYGEELQRVDDQVHGWILLDVNGEEKEIADYTDAEEILPLDLVNLRDLLVIRNSDLHMFNQAECLDRATDLMMGLRTGEIGEIKSALKERGQLTDARMDISTAGGRGSAGEQLKLAKKLVKGIDEYHGKVKQSEIPKLESRIITKSSRLAKLEIKEMELEEARKIRDLGRLKSAFEQSNSALETLERMPHEIIEKGSESLEDFRKNRHNRDRLTTKVQMLNRLLVASLISTGLLGFAAILLNANLFSFVQLIALLTVFFALFVYRWQISSQLDTIEERRVILLEVANKLGLDTVDVSQAIEFVSAKIDKKEKNQNDLKENIGALKNRLDIQSDSNEKVLKQAQEEIEKREKNIDHSVEREYNRDEYSNVKDEIDETEDELARLRKQAKEHNDKLQDFDDGLRKLRFQRYLGRPAEYSPTSIDSLLLVKEDLEEFISAIENEARRCRLAIKVMDSLAAEEKKKVSDLLSENSRASEIFSEITGGRYSEIIYNPGEEEIRAVKQDGTEMPVLNLSRGAKDQLYLSIRLALAERILKGDSGFFILDDPFLASDLKRRDIQIETLEKMVEQGWQVLYFSANRNLAEKFKSRFGHEYRTLPPLE